MSHAYTGTIEFQDKGDPLPGEQQLIPLSIGDNPRLMWELLQGREPEPSEDEFHRAIQFWLQNRLPQDVMAHALLRAIMELNPKYPQQRKQ